MSLVFTRQRDKIRREDIVYVLPEADLEMIEAVCADLFPQWGAFLSLGASGKLLPEQAREVFARLEGLEHIANETKAFFASAAASEDVLYYY